MTGSLVPADDVDGLRPWRPPHQPLRLPLPGTTELVTAHAATSEGWTGTPRAAPLVRA